MVRKPPASNLKTKDYGPTQAVVYDAAFDAQQRAVAGSSAGIAQAWRMEN